MLYLLGDRLTLLTNIAGFTTQANHLAQEVDNNPLRVGEMQATNPS
jgi:hypothetical protein